MAERILVINPNSSRAVTAAIDEALACFRLPEGPAIDCVEIATAPAGIESQRDVDLVAPMIAGLVAAERDRADAFVIACFSDPGLHGAREATAAPVLGIAQCGLHAAMAVAERVGIVSILEASIPRHRRYLASLGLNARLAGDRALGLGVAELAEGPRVLARLTEVGRRLIDEDGASALVLGCAGMAGYRRDLEARLGVPVIDPTQAAVAEALRILLTAREPIAAARRQSA